MFRHDRRELESLAVRLDAERARVARSRARLSRAGRHVFDNKLALLAPLTAGALTGAAALHREPGKGGRFSVGQLLASATAVTGIVELLRETVLPALTGARDEPDGTTGPDGSAPGRRATPLPARWRPPAQVRLPDAHPATAASDAGASQRPERPWPQRIPPRS